MTKFGFGGFQGPTPIGLSTRDFEEIEAAAGISFSKGQRQQIVGRCREHQLFCHGFESLPEFKDVERLVKQLDRGLKATQEAMDEIKELWKDQDKAAVAVEELLELNLRVNQSEGLRHIWDFYQPLIDMRRAVEKFHSELPYDQVFPGRGRKSDIPFLREFVLQLADIFEDAGGSATVNWDYNEDKRQSRFVDFVWAVMQNLPANLQVQTKAALAERMRRFLKDSRRGRKDYRPV